MGTYPSKEQTLLLYGVQQFDQEEWLIGQSILKRTSSTAKLQKIAQECQPTSIYSSQKYSFLIDQYLLDPNEPLNNEQYLKQIKWRNGCEQLVNIKYIKGFHSPTICQASLNLRYIYTEHIPLRLSQITDVPFPDNLYLLKACLKGFHYIFGHVGCLNIRQDLICLNADGKIRVWMNANHSKNSPRIQNIFKLPKQSEMALVKDIINMVDENTDHQSEPKKFKTFLKQFNLYNLNFVQCIEAVDHFAKLLKIDIPSNLQSVNGLFNPLLNKLSFEQQANTYGRLIDTNETKMVQSIPLHRDERVNSEYINNSNYIQTVEHYPCQTNHEPRREAIEMTNERNIIFRPVIKTEETYLQQYPSSQILIEQSTPPVKIDEPEWRYFDLKGWVDIDQQILLDLKKISVNF